MLYSSLFYMTCSTKSDQEQFRYVFSSNPKLNEGLKRESDAGRRIEGRRLKRQFRFQCAEK